MNDQSNNSGFAEFYRHQYWDEHQNTGNLILHMVGTIAGIGLIVAGATIIPYYWMLLFPLAHAGPGLLGHFLFERNAEAGNLRVLRRDVPGWWFLVANHLMTGRTIIRLFTLRHPFR
jgi:hypothetical protein